MPCIHTARKGVSFAFQTKNQRVLLAGFGWFQLLLLLYTGLAWAADAMEMMLLSFLGPAVRCDWGLSATQVPESCKRPTEQMTGLYS